jgi:DNA-binding transcriptional regulator YiaG
MNRHADGIQHEPAAEKDRSTVQARKNKTRTLPKYDATPLVGLRTYVHDAAIERIDENGEFSIELPRQRELMAASAVLRCLMDVRLRGWEVRAMRKIMGTTAAEFAKNLDEKTAPETVSRWETETQPMGGYVEKLIRLLVCETLRSEAPGIDYEASKIAHLRVKDPWLLNRDVKVPYMHIILVRLKEQSGAVVDAWDERRAA